MKEDFQREGLTNGTQADGVGSWPFKMTLQQQQPCIKSMSDSPGTCIVWSPGHLFFAQTSKTLPGGTKH